MQRHEWRETEGDETHYWRADHHGGRWKFSEKPPGERHWSKIDSPKTEHWEALRGVLFNKYQRKRCSWNLIAKIDKILGKPNEGRD